MASFRPAIPWLQIRESGHTAICAHAATRSKLELRKSSTTSSDISCLDCPGATKTRKLCSGDRMQFGFSESQEILKDSARKFFAGECPMEEVRRLMETDTAYDAGLWTKMAEQGYTGIIFPEEYGGVGLGIVELILLMEEAGRALLPGPFFSTVVMAGNRFGLPSPRGQKKKNMSPRFRGRAGAPGAVVLGVGRCGTAG